MEQFKLPKVRLPQLALLEAADADTGFMHEGFHVENPLQFTRPWFAWSNSLFSQLIYSAMDKGILGRKE